MCLPLTRLSSTLTAAVLEYIRAEVKDEQRRDMLIQAFEMRSLVVLIDGIDEAAGLKDMIEIFILNVLVPIKLSPSMAFHGLL